MRIAIISDIHGNEQALDVVTTDIAKSKIDIVLCLGDVATLGPSPNETLNKVRELDCLSVTGNHEQALFRPDRCEEFDIRGKMLEESIYWSLGQLSAGDLAFLKSFEPSVKFDIGLGRSLLGCHASPGSTVEGIYPQSISEVMESEFKELDQSVAVLAVGHTHEQLLAQWHDLLIVNPGSVGCAFKTPLEVEQTPALLPVAEYAIMESGTEINIEFRRIPYDVDKFASVVASTSNPLNSWWLDEVGKLTSARKDGE